MIISLSLYISLSLSLYIYIYIYIYIRQESVRFDSFRFRTFLKLIGSVRFGSDFSFCSDSTRFGLRFLDTPWLGPVRFGSVPRPVPAGSGIKWFGSVRFGRFGSVSHAFLTYIYIYIYIHTHLLTILSPTILSTNNLNSGNTILEFHPSGKVFLLHEQSIHFLKLQLVTL